MKIQELVDTIIEVIDFGPGLKIVLESPEDEDGLVTIEVDVGSKSAFDWNDQGKLEITQINIAPGFRNLIIARIRVLSLLVSITGLNPLDIFKDYEKTKKLITLHNCTNVTEFIPFIRKEAIKGTNSFHAWKSIYRTNNILKKKQKIKLLNLE